MKKITLVALLVGFMVGLNSCSDNDEKEVEPEKEAGTYNFALWPSVGSWPNVSYFVLGFDKLTDGTASLSGQGADVTTTVSSAVITKNGYYYFYNTTEGKFSKFQFKDDQFTTVSQVPYTHLTSMTGHTWADDNTLIMVGLDATSTKINYSVVNITTMTITNGQIANVPAIPTGFTRLLVGGDIQFVNGKFFMSVGFMPAGYEIYPEMTVLEVNYPSFSVGTVSKDARTAGVGSTSGYYGTSFKTESNDIYFLVNWNPAWKNGEYSPIMAYRIKSGANGLDPNYIIDTKAVLGYEASGLFMNVGNGKAIIKYKDTSITGNYNTLYAIIDLETGKLHKKLTELPGDRTGERNVCVGDNKAYIAINADSDKDNIWIYDSQTDAITKGLEIEGGYSSFTRLDKLN